MLEPLQTLKLFQCSYHTLGLICEAQLHFRASYASLMSELLWLMTYLSASFSCATANAVLLECGRHFFLLCNRLFVACASFQSQTPLLRAVANLFNLADDLKFRQAFAECHGLCVGILLPALHAQHRGVLREGSWFLRCLLQRSLQTQQAEFLLESPGELVGRVLRVFCDYGPDIKRELAPFVFELLRRRLRTKEVLGGCLSPFLSLLKIRDLDVATLALRFTEYVLENFPNGARLVDRAGGIEDLEYLEMHSPDPHLSNHIHKLVDRYFGLDYDG